MKLLNTIKNLVNEAEENYETAVSTSTNSKEILALEEKLEDSLKLLSLYESVEKEKED
jgi:hypothetical protein|tara:strand:+ start:4320 stop:4493 length:174 start_codon:yes stop_codon:yes gene_type:complete